MPWSLSLLMACSEPAAVAPEPAPEPSAPPEVGCVRPPALDADTVYVAPDGDDAADGTEGCPLRTLERARDVVRERLELAAGDQRVVLRGGTWRLSAPLVLDARDSGRDGGRVWWEAAEGEVPVLSGAVPVTGFVSADGLLSAPLPGEEALRLFVDGRLARRARSEQPLTWTPSGWAGAPAGMEGWPDLERVLVRSHWMWMTVDCPVAGVEQGVIALEPSCWELYATWIGLPLIFDSLDNARALLDEPGEWYHELSTQTLLYLPHPGEEPQTVEAPRAESLVEIAGTVDAPVQDITLRGLTFAYTGWAEPAGGYVAAQAGIHLVEADPADWTWETSTAGMPAAVNLRHTRGVHLQDNTFRELGAAALGLQEGAKDSVVVGNRMLDLAGNGLQLGDIRAHHPEDDRLVLSDNLVENNLIRGVGLEYPDAVGVFVAYVRRLTLRHNDLRELPYLGVQLGWGWGMRDAGGNPAYNDFVALPLYDTPTVARENAIEANRIETFMTALDDGGGIYTQSAQPDSVISRNYLVSMISPYYGAIYLDDGTKDFRVYGNVIEDVTHAWFVHDTGIYDGRCGNARDNELYGNFSTATAMPLLCPGDNDVHDNAQGLTEWPPEALEIQEQAGLEPAWRHLLEGG
jgi:hypothetical protein